MMTDKDARAIADHYNKLRDRATPFILSGKPTRDDWHSGMIVATMVDQGAELSARIESLLKTREASWQLQELAEAAKKGREADVIAPSFTHHYWPGNTEAPWEATERFWQFCRHEIVVCIEAYNAETLADFERYRAACEQGIAIPPNKV